MKIHHLLYLAFGLVLLGCKNEAASVEESDPPPTSIQAEVQLKESSKVQPNLEVPIKQNVKESDLVSTETCTCSSGIGSNEGDKPGLLFTFSSGTSLSVCGFFDKEMQHQGKVFSEFNVFNCETRKSLVEYDANQLCRVVEQDDLLVIEELRYLPVGYNWGFDLVQVNRQQITERDGEIFVSHRIPMLAEFDIDSIAQQDFLNSLKRGGGYSLEWEEEIAKLEVLSLLGNERAWEILRNYENFKGSETDGAIAETWADALAMVEWITGKKRK